MTTPAERDERVYLDLGAEWGFSPDELADPAVRQAITASVGYRWRLLDAELAELRATVGDLPTMRRIDAAARRLNDAIAGGRDRVLRRWWGDPR